MWEALSACAWRCTKREMGQRGLLHSHCFISPGVHFVQVLSDPVQSRLGPARVVLVQNGAARGSTCFLMGEREPLFLGVNGIQSEGRLQLSFPRLPS